MSFQTQILTETCCRVCFIECSPVSIDACEIAELYHELIGYKIISSDVPQKICSDCLEKLSIVQSFKESCDQAEILLEKLRKEVESKNPLFVHESIVKETVQKTTVQDPIKVRTRPPTPLHVRKAREKQERSLARGKYRPRERPTNHKWQYSDLEEYLQKHRINPSDNHLFILEYEKTRPDVSLLPPNEDCEMYEGKEENTTELSCTYCSFKGIKMDFRRHFLAEQHQKLFRCTASCEYFSLDGLRNHLTMRHQNKRVLYRPLQCNFCQFNCVYELTMEKHCKKMHPDEVSELKICAECGETYYCDDLRLQHIVFRCNDGDMSLQLPFEAIFGRDVLTRKVNQFNGKEKQFQRVTSRKSLARELVVCELCGTEVQKRYLNLHIEKIHENIRYECDICGAVYREKGNLKGHMRKKHLGGKKYLCDCGQVFNHWSTRYMHIKTKHLKDYAFACDLCDRRFVKGYHLKNHRLTHFDIYNYACDQCEKVFKNSDRLQIHKSMRHSNKIYACNQCGKQFKNRPLLRQHMRSHLPNKYFCPVCPLSFSVGATLRNHVNTKHPEYEMPPPGTCLSNVNLNELRNV